VAVGRTNASETGVIGGSPSPSRAHHGSSPTDAAKSTAYGARATRGSGGSNKKRAAERAEILAVRQAAEQAAAL